MCVCVVCVVYCFGVLWCVCVCVCVCVCFCFCFCVVCDVWCVVWVGEWRLVGQGLHHTSFTCTIHTSSQHQHIFCLFLLFFSVRLPTWNLRWNSFCVPSMVQPRTDEADLSCYSWLYKLADLELTAVYAESQDEKRPASYVLRDGLCHKVVMSFMHHTTDAVQSSLLAHLVSGLFPLPTKKHCHRSMPIIPLCSKENVVLTSGQSRYRACVSFWCVRRYTHLGLCARRTGPST